MQRRAPARIMGAFPRPREEPVYGDPDAHSRISEILKRHSTNPADVRELAVARLPREGITRVLELGCGYGGFTTFLARHLGPGVRIEGIDRFESNREPFLAAASAHGAEASFLVSELPDRLDAHEGTYDLVVASYSFYFFPSMLNEIVRVLRRGGIFLTLTHSVRNLGELYAFFDSIVTITPLLQIIHRFSAENGETLLRTRFEQVQAIPFPNALRFDAADLDPLLTYLHWKRPFWEGHCDPERIEQGILEQAQQRGEFSLNKDDMIFVARKAGPEPRRFCATCGGPLNHQEVEGRRRQVCSSCKRVAYVNPLPVASALVVNEARELLLVRRARDPYKGMWCMPVGFAEVGETIAEAALRELVEEAGVEGEIVCLVDAGSHENPVYGDLLIVTFEVRARAGTPCAGDDADEVGWFPVRNVPRLAFDAQARALERYVEAHAEEWRIVDSMRTLATRGERAPLSRRGAGDRDPFLSDELIRMIEDDHEAVVRLWMEDVCTNPSTPAYRGLDPDLLEVRGEAVLGRFGDWLRRVTSNAELATGFRAIGRSRRRLGIPLQELVASFILFKKHLWLHGLSRGVWQSTSDVVRLLEMDRRVVAFFDHAIFHVIVGYEEGDAHSAR